MEPTIHFTEQIRKSFVAGQLSLEHLTGYKLSGFTHVLTHARESLLHKLENMHIILLAFYIV